MSASAKKAPKITSGRDGTVKVVATNRSARHDYTILDTIEAGLVLRGSEVKSLREAQVQLKEAHGRIDGHEAWVVGMHISPYGATGVHDLAEPDRKRKLLLNRSEIDRLKLRMDLERLTLVPLVLYFKDGRAKLELGLAKGRTKGDKRQAIAERDALREAQKEMGRARKGLD
ncbi:SsrA-binding protein SmpB [Rhabdothermincola salaria]|uniref:SsrA-binding protein SmpB n=1 Tax=Rhabdothermincola salaria TaxID=2903142 RepID=UPI001E3D14C6|nr:SsrA-binding protein SmpB [Rhabdothermincola salaria]MCD9623266.1 SsrA-binding protein SmpB [Rhabdothermincola salaria]